MDSGDYDDRGEYDEDRGEYERVIALLQGATQPAEDREE